MSSADKEREEKLVESMEEGSEARRRKQEWSKEMVEEASVRAAGAARDLEAKLAQAQIALLASKDELSDL